MCKTATEHVKETIEIPCADGMVLFNFGPATDTYHRVKMPVSQVREFAQFLLDATPVLEKRVELWTIASQVSRSPRRSNK